MRIKDFCRCYGKAYLVQGNLTRTFPNGPVTWKVMQRSSWKDIANWRTKQLSSYTKSQLHVLTTISSMKKKWDQLEDCQNVCSHKFVLKCMYLARIGRPDISWSVNKLAVTKWTTACDNRLARFDLVHSSLK